MKNARAWISLTSLALVLGACGGSDADSTIDNVEDSGSGSAGNDGSAGGGSEEDSGSDADSGSAGHGGEDGGDGGTGGDDGGDGGDGGSGVDEDGDGVDATIDCDDHDPNVGAKLTFYLDADQDHYGVDVAATNLVGCNMPVGYAIVAGDCDDGDPTINPGAEEVCNGQDDNCNGQIDEGVSKNTYYPDADGDGFGADSGSVQACTIPSGSWALVGGDCDDSDSARYPGNPEICDGKDNDCDSATPEPAATTWYKDADGDGYGNPAQSLSQCSQPTGYVANNLDCNDANKNINPGAIEICDGTDNNCNGTIDEGPLAAYPDKDKDGYGDAKAEPTYRCGYDANWVADNTDCDDNNKNINPGATEIPGNGIDENCDGVDTALGTVCGAKSFGVATLPYGTSGTISSADNAAGNPRGTDYYWHDYEIATTAGQVLTVLYSKKTPQTTSTFAPSLYWSANSCSPAKAVLNWASGHPVDSLHRMKHVISPAQAGYYWLVLSTLYTKQSGNYVFEVVPGDVGSSCGKNYDGVFPLGWRQAGTISSSDTQTGSPIKSGNFGRDSEFFLEKDRTYTLLYGGTTFAPYMLLSSGNSCGSVIASAGQAPNGPLPLFNGPGTRIVYTPASAGVYAAWLTTGGSASGQTGSYVFNVVPGNVGETCFAGDGNKAGKGDSYTFYPVSSSTNEKLAIGDRSDTWLGSRYFDDFETWLEAGESVTFTVTTPAGGFVPKLLVTGPGNRAAACTTAVKRHDPTTGNTATVTYTPTVSGIYTLVVSSYAENATGGYTLSGKYN